MFSLESQTALVTGATGGIGKAIVLALASRGATVAISGTRESVLQELSREVKDLTGKDAVVLPCSLSDQEAVERLIPQAEEAMGKLDILVNNAGKTKDSLTIRMSDDQWQQVIDVNLTATFKLCRSALKSMIKKEYGRIINISSVVGLKGNAGQANYCASKAGMIGMSKAMAMEVASRNITVNCIAPGFIGTDMTENLKEQVKENILGATPTKRMGTPQEIASAVVYLASKESAFITGHTLNVNGGLYMQ